MFVEEVYYVFSQKNDLLLAVMIEQFIFFIEGQLMDDYIEFVFCMCIFDIYDFYVIIYWWVMLMFYQYFLVIFNKKGELIDKWVIVGIILQGGMLIILVVIIEDDWKIYIVFGQSQVN